MGAARFRSPATSARLGAAFGALRALVAGRELQAETAAGVPMAQWRTLADKLKSARYAVVVWAAADFDFPHAELTVRALCELIKDLNRSSRAAGLPLGGSDGDFTADGVELWQTGFPFRTGFGSGVPEYDPQRFATARLLAQGEADALLWIASFDERRGPPGSAVPTVVLGRPGMVCEREPEVFIPVGTPGVDHAGHLFRTDKVVMLPLRQLRESGLPSVARVVAAIGEAIRAMLTRLRGGRVYRSRPRDRRRGPRPLHPRRPHPGRGAAAGRAASTTLRSARPGGDGRGHRPAHPHRRRQGQHRPHHAAGGSPRRSRCRAPHSPAPAAATPRPPRSAAGYRYAEMGYTACFEPAVLPVNARQAHMEMADTPMLDTGGYAMLGNDDFLLRLLAEGGAQEAINDYVAWTLHADPVHRHQGGQSRRHQRLQVQRARAATSTSAHPHYRRDAAAHPAQR